jgi:hypothetical protein
MLNLESIEGKEGMNPRSAVSIILLLSAALHAGAPIVIDLAERDPDLQILGANRYDRTAISMDTGSINGDRYEDLVFGVHCADPEGREYAGMAHVILGREEWPALWDLESQKGDFVVLGRDIYDRLGYSVACGDLNGDRFDDVIIGAHHGDAYGRVYCGEAYVIFGGPDFEGELDLSRDKPDVRVSGEGTYDRLGSAMAVGDLNGDGFDDLAVSASNASTKGRSSAGAIYVLLGRKNWPSLLDMALGISDFVICGPDSGSHLGSSLETGDLNGDGFDDLVIGSPQMDPEDRPEAGIVHIIHGSRTLPDTIDLANESADVTLRGRHASDWLGVGLATGDINRDGQDDILLGAIYGGPEDRERAGEVYLMYGRDTFPDVIDFGESEPDAYLLGPEDTDEMGRDVCLVDMTDDGRADLLVGAYAADTEGRDRVGKAFVLFGSDSLSSYIDLSETSADITVIGEIKDDRLGTGFVGCDLNGDRKKDLVISEFLAWVDGKVKCGKISIFWGGDCFLRLR